MSAINTAAIASPHVGPRPPGLTPRNGLNNDYDDYRHGQFSHSASAANTHTPITAFNGLYDSGRMLGGMGYEQLYPPTLQHQGFEARQLSPFPMDYRPQSQQAMGLPPTMGPNSGYPQPNLHHTSSFTSQHENNHVGNQSRQAATSDWTQSFQGMSLGR